MSHDDQDIMNTVVIPPSIEERLLQLEDGQTAIITALSAQGEAMKHGFEAMQHGFEQMNRRFDEVLSEIRAKH